MTDRPLLPYCFEIDVWPYCANDRFIRWTDTYLANRLYSYAPSLIEPDWEFAAQVAAQNHHLIPGWTR